MKQPKGQNQVRAFIGLLNHYRFMWTKWLRLLHTLTTITSNKVNFKWSEVHQKEF